MRPWEGTGAARVAAVDGSAFTGAGAASPSPPWRLGWAAGNSEAAAHGAASGAAFIGQASNIISTGARGEGAFDRVSGAGCSGDCGSAMAAEAMAASGGPVLPAAAAKLRQGRGAGRDGWVLPRPVADAALPRRMDGAEVCDVGLATTS